MGYYMDAIEALRFKKTQQPLSIIADGPGAIYGRTCAEIREVGRNYFKMPGQKLYLVVKTLLFGEIPV